MHAGASSGGVATATSSAAPGGISGAMILAAGFGTRLRPLTDERPKPLVWIGDRPLLAHLVERLARAGVQRVVMNTFHRAEDFGGAALSALALPVTVLREVEILGTAGGVANAAEALGAGNVLVWNGDILVDLDVATLGATHAAAVRDKKVGATLGVAPRARGTGTVGVGAGGEVVRLRGERFGEEVAGGDFVGVQVIAPELRRRLPAQGCLVGDGYLPWLREGRALSTFAAPAAWDDVGTLGTYLHANARWLGGRGEDAFVGEGAVVEAGVSVIGSVVGAGARVRGSGVLRGCVVWPGAEVVVEGELSGAVVTAGGVTAPAGGLKATEGAPAWWRGASG
ncbi:Mannose-1-phosphate guanylyltransferase [Chondromyces apiculatus DSM 436]|uniref:Mannose-1-phosphate guanylyltransferase n=1 Tax=Chondromyces apiculatus DSM 436 TaxID=1192034 RepID=A0A017TGW3_9BACT|nr:Mannose-1-phosphate guanylyltransferase [Chondromyces apiculatus DSM 436]